MSGTSSSKGLGAVIGRGVRSPIGVDVGRRCINAVQLERPRGTAATPATGWRVAAATTVPRSSQRPVPDAAEVRQLTDTLERQGFTGTDIVLAAGAGLLASVLELPPLASAAPLEQIARMELARTHKCAPDSFEMGCWDLPAPARAQKATHVMAVALPHAAADEVLNAFEAEGLNVCGLDVRPCALARACAPLTDAAPTAITAITAILDLGWGTAELALLYHGAVIYGRTLADAGLGRLLEALCVRHRVEADVAGYLVAEVGLADKDKPSAAGDDDAEIATDARGVIAAHVDAIAQELQASFAYATHQYADATVKRLLLVGGGAGMPGLAAHLAPSLGIEVCPAPPAALVDCGPRPNTACASPSLTAALGLSMYPEF